MEYTFKNYHGARLVNIVATFLRRHGKNPIPTLSPFQMRVIYNENGLMISFFCTKSNHGYYEIKQTNNGIPQINRTPIFFYYDGR